MAAKPYKLLLTDTARSVYEEIASDALACIDDGDTSNSKVTRYNMVTEVLEKIIPHDPFNRERALSGSLSNIFRISKGRMRICYIGSSSSREIIVLYISDTPRKDGDSKDPYKIFSRLVLSGEYDDFFEKLGIKPPLKKMGAAAGISIQ